MRSLFLGCFWTKIWSDNCFETVSTPGLLLEGWHCSSSNFVYNFNKTPWFPLMWMVRFVTFVHKYLSRNNDQGFWFYDTEVQSLYTINRPTLFRFISNFLMLKKLVVIYPKLDWKLSFKKFRLFLWSLLSNNKVAMPLLFSNWLQENAISGECSTTRNVASGMGFDISGCLCCKKRHQRCM